MKKILILGAGFGGLESALSLGVLLDDNYSITLIDKSDSFFIGFSKFEILFDRKKENEIKYMYRDLNSEKVSFIQDEVIRIDITNKRVGTKNQQFEYDYLIIALGADVDYQAIPGFVESGCHEFYTLQGAMNLNKVISSFSGGTVLICIFGNPYKCPPAPFEGAMQLHDFFVDRGIRDKVDLKMVIPMPGPLPIAQEVSEKITELLEEMSITLTTGTQIERIEPERRKAISKDNNELSYDLLIGVPVHIPPKVVRESWLSDGGFIKVSNETLETEFIDVYAVGDVAHIPFGEGKAVPKAGALAEDAAKTVVQEILKKEKLVVRSRKFEAAGTCFLEFNRGKVAKLNANFLGGDKPKVSLEGLTRQDRQDKINFEKLRRDRWFKRL